MNIAFRKQLAFISLVSLFVLILAGCLGNQPESVLENEVKYLDNGEFENLLNLYVKPDTLQPYTTQEKEIFLRSIKMMGMDKTHVQDFKIINKTKITDDRYLITTYTKYTMEGQSEPKEETRTRTVVKLNGEWKIAEKLPGFESVFMIIALIGSSYVIRKRRQNEYLK